MPLGDAPQTQEPILTVGIRPRTINRVIIIIIIIIIIVIMKMSGRWSLAGSLLPTLMFPYKHQDIVYERIKEGAFCS